MKRFDLGNVHKDYVAECNARRNMSPAERKVFDRRRDLPLYNAKSRSDTEGTSAYLCKLAMRLEDGEALSQNVRRYLATAITETAIDPKKAGAAFGLVPSKGRPETDIRKILAAIASVRRLNEEGIPLNGNRKRHGAFSQAGEKHRLSPQTLKNWWDMIREWERQEEE